MYVIKAFCHRFKLESWIRKIKEGVYRMYSKVKNTIVWIDGANGVGKSHVAAKLAEILADRNAEYVESDLYWEEAMEHFPDVFRLGSYPCNNRYLVAKLREELDEKMKDTRKITFVSMTMASQICANWLLDYFSSKGIHTFHIILLAKQETLISRIKNDPIRTEAIQEQQIKNLNWQVTYLQENYPDAVKIDTEDKPLEKIINEIMLLLRE